MILFEQLDFKKLQLGRFLKTLRESDLYIGPIFSQGGCYQLYKVVKTMFPEAQAYTNLAQDHILIKFKGKFYDIFGEYTKNVEDLKPLTEEQHEMAQKWSFHRKNMLLLCECPHCEEPITYVGKEA